MLKTLVLSANIEVVRLESVGRSKMEPLVNCNLDVVVARREVFVFHTEFRRPEEKFQTSMQLFCKQLYLKNQFSGLHFVEGLRHN